MMPRTAHLLAAAAAALAATAPTFARTEAPAMPQTSPEAPRALTLDVDDRDGMIEVRLIGLSDRTQAVRYSLEISGTSTSRHRGSTKLTAGTQAVLSTMRTAAGDNWCVKLVAEEEGRAPYEVTHGTCTAD